MVQLRNVYEETTEKPKENEYTFRGTAENEFWTAFGSVVERAYNPPEHHGRSPLRELIPEAEKPVAMDGREAPGGEQICMQEAGQIERAASRTRARTQKDWASTTAADGARLAHRWSRWRPGRRWTRTGWQSSRKNRLIWCEGVARSLEGRAYQIMVVSAVLPSYHLQLLTICGTSVVRSARTLPLVATTCNQICT